MPQAIQVKAPVTGIVGDVKVKEGEIVAQGALLAIQTVTKTESQVRAPVAGRIKTIATKGASLTEGEVLAEIEY